jgi:hypothetical protein
MNEHDKELMDNFDRARKAIHSTGMSNGVYKFELEYGLAYKKLVTAGLAPKLRIKYRP